MKGISVVTSLLVLVTFSGAQLQSSVERPCPRKRVTFTCTIPSNGHQWDISFMNISRSLLPNDQGRVISDPPFQFTVTEVVTRTSIKSTATVTVTTHLNGTLIVCRDGIGMLPEQNHAINILGPPSVPTLSCVDLSEDVSGAVNVIVSWTLSGGDSADFYLVNITTNAPQTPYDGLLNITIANVTQHELTDFMTGYEYNITLYGVNCGSLVGREGEPLIIRPQVPTITSSCNITLLYDQFSRRLLFINSTWFAVPDTVDPCPDLTGNITQYRTSIQTGSVVNTENVNIARCTAGKCSHTFEPPSNPPSSYDSVSVAAENVVGVGPARNCTSQSINTRNNLLTGVVISLTSPSDARINCIFLSGFTGTTRCRIQYGTDPTYMNLPYSAESTETGTAGDTVSVVLRERLNSSTVYYYTMSPVSGDFSVVVQGTFTSPLYSCNLMELWNLPAAGVTFLSNLSSLEDSVHYPSCGAGSVGSIVLVNTTLDTATVAYYTGTTPGSRTCFVCDEGYEINTTTNERVCQRNGLWSRNPIVCECRLPPWTLPLVGMSILALVTILIGATVTISDSITDCCIQLRKLQLNTGGCCSDTKKEDGMDKTNCCWRILLITAAIWWAIGVILWIAVGVVVSNPPNDTSFQNVQKCLRIQKGNNITTSDYQDLSHKLSLVTQDYDVCDPSWRSTRDGLIGSAFAVSIVAYIFGTAMIWTHIYYHKNRIKEKSSLTILVVIALIFFITGVGVWIASAVLVSIHNPLHCQEKGTNGEEGQNQGDGSGKQKSRTEKEKEKKV